MSDDLPTADEPSRAEPELPEEGYSVAPPVSRSANPEPIYCTTPEDEAGPEPEKDYSRYQFSLRELLSLMVGVCLLLSLLGLIPGGYSPASFAGLAGWGAVLALIVLSVLKPERAIVYVAWAGLLFFYMAACLAAFLQEQ